MTPNKRILVIDDDPAILTTYRLILQPGTQSSWDATGKELFGPLEAQTPPPAPLPFDLTLQAQPEAGVQAARDARDRDRPFAGAFVDMKMPRMDGIQVIRELIRIDPRMGLALVTAQSGPPPRADLDLPRETTLLFLAKPFSAGELRRTAREMTRQWNP